MRKIKEYPLNGKLTPGDLKRMPKGDLLILLLIINSTLKKIKNQIDVAHAKKRKACTKKDSGKKSIDDVWLNRAKQSRKIKKFHRDMVEKELGIKKRIFAKQNRLRNSVA